MSIFSSIKTDFGKIEADAAKFEAAFVKIFKKLPSAEQAVENFTGEVAPVIVAAVAIADPVAEPEVAAALATIETGLAAIQAATTAATTGTSLLANLQNFATTVPTLLAGLQVKNPATTAAIEKVVTLVTSEAKVLIPAVENWIKQIAAAKSAA